MYEDGSCLLLAPERRDEASTGGGGVVAEQLAAVRRRIARAALRSGRRPDDVELVAVSKGHGLDKIQQAYEAGHRVFGENRSDELLTKAAQLPEDISWHFVGQLQSRKAADVAMVAHVIHSLDRAKLVNRLAAVPQRRPVPLKTYLQVNLAGEEQKGGAAVADVAGLVEHAADKHLDVCGLMLIPPLVDDLARTRAWFIELRDLRDRLAADYPNVVGLSMGMTDDFEAAIEEGATAIRVGRAIFGERRGGTAAGLPHA